MKRELKRDQQQLTSIKEVRGGDKGGGGANSQRCKNREDTELRCNGEKAGL